LPSLNTYPCQHINATYAANSIIDLGLGHDDLTSDHRDHRDHREATVMTGLLLL